MTPLHLMTVLELRSILADLPDEDYIMVNGYEGGYDMPRLERRAITSLLPWEDSYGYCGPWTGSDEHVGHREVDVWVLAREGRS